MISVWNQTLWRWKQRKHKLWPLSSQTAVPLRVLVCSPPCNLVNKVSPAQGCLFRRQQSYVYKGSRGVLMRGILDLRLMGFGVETTETNREIPISETLIEQLNIQNMAAIESTYLLPEYIFKEMKPVYQTDSCTPIFIASLVTVVMIWNHTCLQQMNKRNVVCIHNEILPSHKGGWEKPTTTGSKGCEEGRKREAIFPQGMLVHHTKSNKCIVIKVMQIQWITHCWKYVIEHCCCHHFWPYHWPSRRDDQTTCE